MPHIHTQFGQHDFTCSLYIINIENPGEPKALLHHHRTLNMLMQPGGHVELDETPWQSAKHELQEETGYELGQLEVLQPKQLLRDRAMQEHPVPLLLTTGEFIVKPGHYHTNLTYAFVTDQQPRNPVAEGESAPLRWLNAAEIEQVSVPSFPGVLDIYLQLLNGWSSWQRVSATDYSL